MSSRRQLRMALFVVYGAMGRRSAGSCMLHQGTVIYDDTRTTCSYNIEVCSRILTFFHTSFWYSVNAF
jgi:hypothetical protein